MPKYIMFWFWRQRYSFGLSVKSKEYGKRQSEKMMHDDVYEKGPLTNYLIQLNGHGKLLKYLSQDQQAFSWFETPFQASLHPSVKFHPHENIPHFLLG